MTTPACPLCDGTDIEIGRVSNRDAFRCRCPRCGGFVFTPEASLALKAPANNNRRFIVSGHTRNASERGQELELLASTVDDLLGSAAEKRTPHDVLDPLLMRIHDKANEALEYVRVPDIDYPLFFLPSARHLRDYLALLSDLGLVERALLTDPKDMGARLTLAGWQRVADLRKIGKSSNKAFVAMSFAKDLDEVYAIGIQPALTETGWLAVRMDRVEHNDRIDDRIVADIRSSGLVIADFTNNRAGVYFEAGLAMGLGLPVIWTVRESDLAAVHFDTRQYNHIVWKEPGDLRERLRDRIKATVRPTG